MPHCGLCPQRSALSPLHFNFTYARYKITPVFVSQFKFRLVACVLNAPVYRSLTFLASYSQNGQQHPTHCLPSWTYSTTITSPEWTILSALIHRLATIYPFHLQVPGLGSSCLFADKHHRRCLSIGNFPDIRPLLLLQNHSSELVVVSLGVCWLLDLLSSSAFL